MANKDDSEHGIARYSSSQINRGLDLAKKVSVATAKTSSAQKINVEQVDSNMYTQDAEYCLKLAMQQITPTEYQYALANIQKAIDINSDYSEAYIVRYSMIYLPLGYYQEVIHDCDQVLRINSKNAETLNDRGWAYAQLGYHLQALQDYDLALKINPNLEVTYMNRGISYLALSNYQKASGDFKKVIKINPNSIEACYNKGISLFHLRNYIRASINFKKAIHIDSAHIDSHLNLGLCYFNLNEHINSARSFYKAIEIDFEHTKNFINALDKHRSNDSFSAKISLLLVNLGEEFYCQPDYAKAIKCYIQAIAIDDLCEEAYYQRGIAYIKTTNFLAAISDLKKVLLLNPSNADAHISMGLIRHYQGDFAAAIKEYNLALKINPNYELAYIKMAITISHSGDRQGAIDACNKLIEINENNSLAYLLRAKYYCELGNYLQYENNSIKGYMLLSKEQLAARDYRGAIESCSNILELDSNNTDAYNARSTARSAIGDYQGAMEDLNKVRMIS
jgi:tetratricopeptide (TPR) repeat protein